MLQMMRNLAQTWVVKGLMLLLMVSFAIWGIGDIFRGNALKRAVARIGNTAISVQNLDHEFSGTLERARQVSPEITRQQAVRMGMLDATLNKLIEESGLQQEVERLGIDVSDREFLTTLAAMPQFITEDGKFNKSLFERVVRHSNMSERAFLELSRSDMARQQLFNILRSPPHVPRMIAESLYRARGQKRVLDVVTVKDDSFGDIPPPDDKALQDFYDRNQAKFVAPEFRAVTIARLSVDDVAKDIPVSDEDVKKSYDARPPLADAAERRDVVQVMVPDEARAKQLSDSAKTGGNLAAAAKAMGLDALPLDKVEQKGLLPGLTGKIFALADQEVSAPIESASGWQVVQVKKIYPAEQSSFDAMKDRIRIGLQRNRAIEKLTGTVNELDDQLAAGHALEDIADGMKLRLVKIPAVNGAGKGPDGKEPAELPDRDLVLKAAFGQGSGDTSPVLDDRQGNYAVVRTDEVTPAAVPPLAKIRDAVIAEWTKAERAKRAASAADDIAKGLRDGKPASSFAGRTGVSVRVSKPVSLAGDSDPDLPETILPEIFRMKKDEVAVVPLPDSQVVVRLTRFIDVDPAMARNEVDKISADKRDHTPEELVAEYVKYMRVLYPVEIYQSVLDSVRQQGG